MDKWFLLQKIVPGCFTFYKINMIHVQVFLFTVFQINIFRLLTHILHFTFTVQFLCKIHVMFCEKNMQNLWNSLKW